MQGLGREIQSPQSKKYQPGGEAHEKRIGLCISKQNHKITLETDQQLETTGGCMKRSKFRIRQGKGDRY